MLSCPLCSSENQVAAKFCRKCGNQFQQSTVEIIETDTLAAKSIDIATHSLANEFGEIQENMEVSKASSGTDSGSANSQATGSSVSDSKQDALSFEPTGCPACQAHLRMNDNYCMWCGEKQPRRAVAPHKTCQRCHAALPDKANFCHNCGENVFGKA